MRGRSILGRLNRLEQSVPRRCPVCAGWPRGILFRVDGVLQTNAGVPVDEAVLSACPVCGAGDGIKTLEGVNPRLMLGIKVIAGVDPTCI